MQRDEQGGVVISCDFCGAEWNPATGLPPMTEGHRGSALCLACLRSALAEAAPAHQPFECVLCLQRRETGERRWRGTRADATVCWSCIRLAAKTFHKDKDIDFRWNPSDWPRE